MNTAMFTSVRFSSGIRNHLLPGTVHVETPHFTFLVLNLPRVTSTRGVVVRTEQLAVPGYVEPLKSRCRAHCTVIQVEAIDVENRSRFWSFWWRGRRRRGSHKKSGQSYRLPEPTLFRGGESSTQDTTLVV